MFTIDQVTAVQAFFRAAGFDGQLRITKMQRPDQITFAFEPESLIALRLKAGQDLEHIVQQILRIQVQIIPEGQPWNSKRPFDLSLVGPAQASPAQSRADKPATEEEAGESLSIEEGFRAAFFIVDQYMSLEEEPDEGLALFHTYMVSDPARWSDWKESIEKARADPSAASEYLHDWRFRFAPPESFEGP
ncbi:hypothetical protein [Microbacterium capsulatum]|uniref:DUF4304 domain-containing protein n=1 Tax=Microbacterium capsulatum TaxID=3041921 RepID=A0ABU0XCJ1_9MICO|nr:hypothetical protein [Microbacterium sp. ASV81]MDQ4212834.1 hypothetical protein [Microbacterium sp. ASV81]